MLTRQESDAFYRDAASAMGRMDAAGISPEPVDDSEMLPDYGTSDQEDGELLTMSWKGVLNGLWIVLGGACLVWACVLAFDQIVGIGK